MKKCLCRLPQIHWAIEVGRDAATYIFPPLKLWLTAVRRYEQPATGACAGAASSEKKGIRAALEPHRENILVT
uniref:Uncharacterized protein n=1 Tax=Aegilops tauschii subsp. strangulata TaxID=200361 RepID=A0A453BRM1_AEGTS